MCRAGRAGRGSVGGERRTSKRLFVIEYARSGVLAGAARAGWGAVGAGGDPGTWEISDVARGLKTDADRSAPAAYATPVVATIIGGGQSSAREGYVVRRPTPRLLPSTSLRTRMRRGTRADFWRVVEIGLRLAPQDWRPWSLSIDRRVTLNVGSFLHCVEIGRWGCYAGATIWPGKGKALSKVDAAKALQAIEGPGRVGPRNDGGYEVLWGVGTAAEIAHPSGSRGRLRLPAERRATLIRQVLNWLRGQRRRWSAYSIDFRLTRPFRAAGLHWRLTSDVYFARREGLYWNNHLTCVGDKRRRSELLPPIVRDLRAAGFSLGPQRFARRGWLAFDQDFLPTADLVEKARWLSAWRPRPLS